MMEDVVEYKTSAEILKQVDKIETSQLWFYPFSYGRTIHIWIDKVVARIPDADLRGFPINCCDSIDIWFDKIIDKIPSKDLKYFFLYCAKKECVWSHHYRFSLIIILKRIKHKIISIKNFTIRYLRTTRNGILKIVNSAKRFFYKD